jgi:hypothetical protein
MLRCPTLLASSTLLLLACDGGGTGGKDTTDTGGSGGVDTSDTAGDSGTDTGTDTGIDTGVDTGDTGQPALPDNGYFGPPAVVVLAEAGGGDASVYLVDTSTGTATAVADVTVSTSATVSCAANLVWVLDDQGGSGTDKAYGLDGRSGELRTTIDLGAGFAGQAVHYASSTFWVGGLGSASVLAFDQGGTATGSIDLSSLADADGSPEVTRLLTAEGTTIAVLRRQNGAAYETSMIARLDLSTGTLTGSASLQGKNAGRMAGGVPGGVAVEMLPQGSDAGGIEVFDLTSNTSSGRFVEYAGSTRVAGFTSGTDGTFWGALKSGATTAVHHYLPDGTEIDTGFTVGATGDQLATIAPNVYVGEGSSVVPYEDRTGTKGTAISIGAKVVGLHACIPPARPQDTGDTAGAP